MSSIEEISEVTPPPIMQMTTGFWVSKTLMTAAELDVFTKISSYKNDEDTESITLEEFQQHLSLLGKCEC